MKKIFKLCGLLLFSILFIGGVYAEEVLYEQTVGNSFPSDWSSNTDRKWILTGTMDGEITKKWAAYSNKYKSTLDDSDTDRRGLNNDSDYLEIIINGLDIDINGYQDVRLNIDSIVQSYNNSVTNYSLEVYVKNENSNTFGPFYLEDYEVKGFYLRKVGDTSIYERNLGLVTQKINMTSGSKIKEIIIKPYGNYPTVCDASATFDSDWHCADGKLAGIAGVKLVGYENSNYARPSYIEYNNVDISDVRKRTVQRMYDEATIEWIPRVTFTEIRSLSSHRLSTYEKSKTYFGMPYTQKNRVTVEKFDSEIDSSGKLSLPDGLSESDFEGLDINQTMDLMEQNIGQDCATAVSYAISKYIPLFSMYDPADWIWDRNKTTILGNLLISGKLRTSDLSNLRNSNGSASVQELYEGYAELQIGDVISRHNNGNTHVRLISGNTIVVRNNDGTINPTDSYVIETEIRSATTVANDPNLYGGSVNASSVVPFIPNKNYTSINSFSDLQGKNINYNINTKISFQDLYNNGYIPLRLNDYITGKIEKPYARLINKNIVSNIKDGFKGTIYSNYTIIGVTYRIDDYTNGENFEYTYYPTHKSDSIEDRNSTIYSLYYNTPDEVQTTMKQILSDSTNYEVKVSVTVGEEEKEVLDLKTSSGNSGEGTTTTDTNTDSVITNPKTGENVLRVIGVVVLLLVSAGYLMEYGKRKKKESTK